MNPDASRSPIFTQRINLKDGTYTMTIRQKEYERLCREAERASLIAFVQKHRLSVTYSHGTGALCKGWNVHGMYLHGFKIVNGKTWIAAVRKAKRVIEKGKSK